MNASAEVRAIAVVMLKWLLALAVYCAVLTLAWMRIKRHDVEIEETATADAWARGSELFIDPPIPVVARDVRAARRAGGAR